MRVGAGLLTICWVMEAVQNLFSVFPGFIEQRNILRVPDMRRRTGSVYDHGTAVAAGSGTLIFIVVILRFCRLSLTRFCILHDHLVDLAQNFRCQPLTEVYHQRGIKGQFAIVVARIAAEILQVRVLLDLERGLLVRIAILRLDDAGAQRQTQRLGYVPFTIGKQRSVPLFNLRPRDRLGLLDPSVSLF